MKHKYESASKHDLPVCGTFTGQTQNPATGEKCSIDYIATKIPDLNLLGRNAIQALEISVDNAFKDMRSIGSVGPAVTHPTTPPKERYATLSTDCHALCDQFPDLLKEEWDA